ncbi:hypothetical protein AYL20_01250 [Acinetobacter venetianus]|uniref:hypothetical protein n=1 Tax=Acinetobacter venetianus TaxID=52133 RepID=UPI000775E4E6|nr:hypothetical protein [Acinetobacter venetianus]KXO82650.1 hypothetical protein AYL20_01250 [Acinetobacter venetianus]
MKKLVCLGMITLSLVGCATAEIIPIGTDTYMISQTSAGGAFKSMSSLKTGVIKRANEYANSQNKVAIPIAEKEYPAYPGRMPAYEYQFKLLDKDDANASGASLKPKAIVIDNNIINK